MQPVLNIGLLTILREAFLVAAKANFLPRNKNLIQHNLGSNIKDSLLKNSNFQFLNPKQIQNPNIQVQDILLEVFMIYFLNLNFELI